MKLAIVHDWLTGMRGGEKCLETLCRLFPKAQLFTLLHVPGSTSPIIERMEIKTSFLQRVPGVRRHYRYLLPLMPAAVEQLRLPDDIDLVVSLSHAVAKSIVPPPGVPHVCYCFTPMRYAWHLRREYFPEVPGAPGDGILQGRLHAPIAAARNLVLDHLRSWDRETADRVTQFISISRTVAQRIQECYGRPSIIIYPPVDTDFYTPDHGPRDSFYLCVSALTPYKRIDLAIQACNYLKRRLVVIGQGPEHKRLKRLAGPTVTLLGWRSDEEIREHLRRCQALLFPGPEDFGIVPLEAQACGTPVIALGRAGALETVLQAAVQQRGTGVFFEDSTCESLATAMLWLEENQDCFSPSMARQQAMRFNRRRFADELLTTLLSVATGNALAPQAMTKSTAHL
jgi:glycosyltransferase involved in cell wall biosynthesis